ncbi:MAG: hypothetical protein LUE31_03985 [Lachnospiraceae bacterium]|nr:hypothetical protein [Lachnospiraceae bacterium]
MECAAALYPKVSGKMSMVTEIQLLIAPSDTKYCIRPGQALHPVSHADADHNVLYCSVCALYTGTLTLQTFTRAFFKEPSIYDLLEKSRIDVMSDREWLALGGQGGACILRVSFENGEVLSESRSCGCARFASAEEYPAFAEFERSKRRNLETVYDLNLRAAENAIFSLENLTGEELITALQAPLRSATDRTIMR